MRLLKKLCLGAGALALVAMTAGCTKKTHANSFQLFKQKEDHNYGALKSVYNEENSRVVAVLPCKYLGSPKSKSAQDVSRFIYNDFFRHIYRDSVALRPYQKMELMDEAEVLRLLADIDDDNKEESIFSKIATKMNADVLVVPEVSEYGRVNEEGSFVTLHLRIYDAEHDTIFWSGSVAASSKDKGHKSASQGALDKQVSADLTDEFFSDLTRRLKGEDDSVKQP